nr:ribonuclease H-like domain-containing protein [Tanacetum cinerariifolium]
MESLSPQVVAAVKLPILNQNEFDLWKMRIELYFLITDYSLWEVILNGDSPTPTRVVDEWRTHTLIWRNKADLEDQSLDDLFNNLKIYEAESNSLQLDNEDLKQIEAGDLEEMDLKSPKDTKNKDTQRRPVPVETSTSNALVSQCNRVDSYDWSFQANEEPTNYALMAFTSSNSSSSSGSNNKVTHCSKAYATLQSDYDKLTVDFRKSQFDVLSYKSGLKYVEARLVVYQQNENVFEKNIKLLKLDVMLRDNALVELRKKFKKAKKERVEKFQTSSKNLSKLLESQITNRTGLGYDNQVFNSKVFDCDELNSSESGESMPTSLVHDRYKSGEGYHVVPPPYTGTFMPPKPDLVFHDPLTASKTVPDVTSARMNHAHSNRHVVPIAVLTRLRLVPLNAARLVTIAVPQPTVKSSKPVKHVVNKAHSLIKRPINHKPAPKHRNFYKTVTIVKVNKGNPHQDLKDKGVIDSGFSRHMTRNISYLSDFKEINGGYVKFGGNPKGGKITGKDTACVVLSSNFKLPDENHVLLSVPRENNMYNVDLKCNAPLRKEDVMS